MNVGQLKRALENVDDETEILVFGTDAESDFCGTIDGVSMEVNDDGDECLSINCTGDEDDGGDGDDGEPMPVPDLSLAS